MNKDLKTGLGIVGILIICFVILLIGLKSCDSPKPLEKAPETANLANNEVLGNEIELAVIEKIKIKTKKFTDKEKKFDEKILDGTLYNVEVNKSHNIMALTNCEGLSSEEQIIKNVSEDPCDYLYGTPMEIAEYIVKLFDISKEIGGIEEVETYDCGKEAPCMNWISFVKNKNKKLKEKAQDHLDYMYIK